MLTPWLAIIVLLFCYFSSSVIAVGATVEWRHVFRSGDALACDSRHGNPLLIGQVPDPRNCLRAIEMIPGGVRPLDPHLLQTLGRPDPARPISLEIDKHIHGYRPPAIFHSRDCDVQVRVFNEEAHSPSTQADSGFMYYDFWPQAKMAAKEIANRCVDGLLVDGRLLHLCGGYNWRFAIGDHNFKGEVQVMYRSPGNWPRALIGNTKIFDADKPENPGAGAGAGSKRPILEEGNLAAKRLKSA